jgi:pyruvate dehydrogenase E2 component (dihydrolipoamide acetyltransferase)
MMRAFSTPLLAALLAAAVSPAAAATAPKAAPAPAPATGVTGDVRCLLTMVALGHDKQRQQAALIGAYFFIGRISVRAPGLNLPAAVKAEAAKLNGQSLNEEAKRCGPLVEGGMHTLQATFGGPRPAPSAGAPAAPPPTASGLPPAIPPAAPK